MELVKKKKKIRRGSRGLCKSGGIARGSKDYKAESVR